MIQFNMYVSLLLIKYYTWYNNDIILLITLISYKILIRYMIEYW